MVLEKIGSIPADFETAISHTGNIILLLVINFNETQ